MNHKNYVLARRVSSMALAMCLSMGALALSGCGGGGGSSGGGGNPPVGGSPPPPPPPPPPNTPPVIDIQLSATEVDEGDTVVLDLTGSSDPDGSIVEVRIQQFNNQGGGTFEPESLVSTSAGRFTFTAPEVFEDEEVIFDVTIQDDRGDTANGNLTAKIINTPSVPKVLGIREFQKYEVQRPIKILGNVYNGYDELYAVDPTAVAPDGGQQILILGDPFQAVQDYSIVRDDVVKATVPSIDGFFPEALAFNLDPGTKKEFTVASEASDKLFWFADFTRTPPNEFVNEVTIDIEAPCHVTGRTNSGQDIMWVGQRNVGLSVVRVNPIRPDGFSHRGFSHNIVTTAGAGRSLCFVYPTRLEALPGVSPISQFDDLIAVDFDANELVLLADRAAPAEEYEVLDVVPIDTDGAPNMKIVEVKAAGTPGEIPNVLWILMSDGIDGGEHRLVLVWQDSDDKIYQKTHRFEGDAPDFMVITDLFGIEAAVDASADVMVVSTSSSQAAIFEDEQIQVNSSLDLIPIYKPVEYIQIGAGAASGIAVSFPFMGGSGAPLRGALLAYPDEGVIRSFINFD